MNKLSCLLVAVLISGSGDGIKTPSTNVARANRIRDRLRITDNGALNIRVNGGGIRVRGTIENADDAQQVLDAILQETNLNEIQLSLGVGKEPAAEFPLLGRSQSGNWMDQFDDPSFDPNELPSPAPVRKRHLTPSFRGNQNE